jgi:hypothetical protein
LHQEILVTLLQEEVQALEWVHLVQEQVSQVTGQEQEVWLLQQIQE